MITVPDYVYKNSSRTLKYDSSSLLEYKITDKKCSCEVMLTSNILIFVIKGKKEISGAQRSKIMIDQNYGIFLKKGNYILARSINEDNSLENTDEADILQDESLLVYLDDSFISDFFIRNSGLFDGINTDFIPETLFRFPINPFIEAAIESTFPLFAHDNTYKKPLLALKSSDLLLNIINSDSSGTFLSILKQCASEQTDLASYMTNNFIRPLSVEQFAIETHRSLSTFKKDFKSIFKMSPKKWINKNRLNKAATLLKHSSMSVTDVGFVVGFTDTSYFITLFKKEFNITPKKLQTINTNKKLI